MPPTGPQPSVPTGPARFTRAALVLTVAAAAWLDFWTYSPAFRRDPLLYQDVLAGTATAPGQYRVAVVHLASFLARHAHLALRHTLTLIDALSALVAVLVVHTLLQRSAVYRAAGNLGRWVGSLALLAGVQWYLAWITWYQRPETLPTAAIVCCLLLCWTPRSPASGSEPQAIDTQPEASDSGQLASDSGPQAPDPDPQAPSAASLALRSLAILALSALQGPVRSDVSFMLHLGIFAAAALTPLGRRLALPRPLALLVSAAAAAIAAGWQLYLSRVLYPHSLYAPDTPVFMLPHNLTMPSYWLPFAVFLAPVAWTVWHLQRRRFATGDAASLALLCGAVLFAALWITVGVIGEVRIFLPFAMALLPLTVEQVMLHAQADTG